MITCSKVIPEFFVKRHDGGEVADENRFHVRLTGYVKAVILYQCGVHLILLTSAAFILIFSDLSHGEILRFLAK